MKLVFRERIIIVADTMMKVIKETNSQSRNLKKKFKEECIGILSQQLTIEYAKQRRLGSQTTETRRTSLLEKN